VIYGQVRAALVSADPLTLALGRPNREQITTTRQVVATTLQALELTNGDTLSKLVKRGAEKLLARNLDGRALVEHVFRSGLGRDPTREERRASLELVGGKPTGEGVEDLLWVVSMLPEFQFVR
jgi:Arc/MetJ family transcription regulator